jgi:hypothetical protein
MEDGKKYDEILKGINKILIAQAVTKEKIINIEEDQDEFKAEQKVHAIKIAKHERIVGAIALSMVILTTLVRFKVI